MSNNFDSKKYWERRYTSGGNSGLGSYGRLAEFKAEIINKFIKENEITKVIEFGCGDGNQLSLFKIYDYIGLDITKIAVMMCRERFKGDKTKSFLLYDPYSFKSRNNLKAEISLSLDVIYHLIKDDIFELYMKHLFLVSNKFVIIYSSNGDDNSMFLSPHCKNRQFSEWIKINLPEWELIKKIKNKYPDISNSNFYIYKKMERD
jgi:SAM-dependent methyltransferase